MLASSNKNTFRLRVNNGSPKENDWSKGQVVPKRGSYFIRRSSKMTAGFSPPRMLPIKNHPFGYHERHLPHLGMQTRRPRRPGGAEGLYPAFHSFAGSQLCRNEAGNCTGKFSAGQTAGYF